MDFLMESMDHGSPKEKKSMDSLEESVDCPEESIDSQEHSMDSPGPAGRALAIVKEFGRGI